jgi:hypothetical protein
VDYKDTDICVCGHMKSTHNINIGWKGYCFICFDPSNIDLRKHEFKLDNLKYIERVAKEKGI